MMRSHRTSHWQTLLAGLLGGIMLVGRYEDLYNQQQQFQYRAQMQQWQQEQQMRQRRDDDYGGGAEMPLPPVDITPPVRTDTLPPLP
jgi:hypothetical protein